MNLTIDNCRWVAVMPKDTLDNQLGPFQQLGGLDNFSLELLT